VSGPLAGLTVVTLGGMGPGPFAAMMLADMGASVVRVDRIPDRHDPQRDAPMLDPLRRGQRSVAVDLRNPQGVEVVLRLVERAEASIEPFRPGVAERLGIGPDVCLARSPALAYGRMTGWGQDGPYAARAGHDINFIALSGALHPIGRAGEPPVPPLNLVGDFGGGGMFLAFGLLCAVLEARASGVGQVVDAAIVDGSAALTASLHGLLAAGRWNEGRGTNRLDGGAPFYDVYETADGHYVSVGALEPRFYEELLRAMGFEEDEIVDQADRDRWPGLRARMAEIFRTRTRDEWCAVMEDRDTCFAPVLSPQEAPSHPHNAHRSSFVALADGSQPAPAPRFSRTATASAGRPCRPGQHTDEILRDWGFADVEVEDLRASGAIS
jgi:alpha-methylacyl-CoA racemase